MAINTNQGSSTKLHWESFYSPLPHIHSKQLPDSSENILDEAVRIINFIKSGPLNIVSLNILCDEMGGVYKALVVHIYKDLKISLYNTAVFVASWTSHFFFFLIKHYLKEQLTNYGYLDVSIWWTFSWKWTKCVCPLKIQLSVFGYK